MGVYIKDMEMPKNCYNCPLSYGKLGEESTTHVFKLFCYCQYLNYKVVRTDSRDKDCPLVELPPHGQLTKRLVYRGEVYNALEAERVNSLDGILTDPYKDGFHDGLKRALQILANEVEDAPTIIEREGEDG